MRELRSPVVANGPFAAASSSAQGLVVAETADPPVRFRLGRHAFRWTRHLLTVVGGVTVIAFIVGVTPIPEKIGDVTGRIQSANVAAQTENQLKYQGALAAAQQQAMVAPQMELQSWQVGLQSDLAALSAALDGAKTILVQKSAADLQGRNALLQTNAELQADRVRQIMQIQEMLERGNISSAQVLDMVRNFAEAFKLDASHLRQQSQSVKTEVLSEVTRVTPISPDSGAGITDPMQPGGVLDADVQVAMADIERRVAAIQERFAVRSYAGPVNGVVRP